MEFYARFEKIDGHIFRFDTRIYLGTFVQGLQSICVGAIVGKNPGSAIPKKLDELYRLDLNGDKMLPFVGNRFSEGFQRAGKSSPVNAFVRVWNLFYICNPDLSAALKVVSSLNNMPVCRTESELIPLVWYGWGGDDSSLNLFKNRFIQRKQRHDFFYDHRAKTVMNNIPKVNDFAKHTQGMPAEPVVGHLATIL